MVSLKKKMNRTVSLRITDDDYQYLRNQTNGKHNNLSRFLRSTIQVLKQISGENNIEN